MPTFLGTPTLCENLSILYYFRPTRVQQVCQYWRTMSIAANGPADANANANSNANTLCIICHLQPSRYSCPRCQSRTCSAPCSNAHKLSMPCSGVRDRAGYVPMNSYGWGAMMDDYVFLEDVGRFVEAQGSLISRGRLTRGVHGRGRGTRTNEFSSRRSNLTTMSKREVLQMQLEFRHIKMDLLPEGMQRQRSNMSRFDSRYAFDPPHIVRR